MLAPAHFIIQKKDKVLTTSKNMSHIHYNTLIIKYLRFLFRALNHFNRWFFYALDAVTTPWHSKSLLKHRVY